jgi:hypothetical protein
MSEAQRLKHIADREALTVVPETFPVLIGAEPTLDGMGAYEGGYAALKASNRWVSEKSHSSCTGSNKNAPGDYASKITHRQDADFNEIHTDANGEFFLYNHKTDAWDIKGDSADLPYYRDLNGDLWAYNYKDGAWTVPVTIEYDAPENSVAPLLIEESDNIPCGDFEESVEKNRELLEELSDVNPEVVS